MKSFLQICKFFIFFDRFLLRVIDETTSVALNSEKKIKKNFFTKISRFESHSDNNNNNSNNSNNSNINNNNIVNIL